MQIFFCTFLIKLQYVKRIKQISQKKLPSSIFEAVLKGSKNQLIATGTCKPTLMNDTAWFNQRFELKSDLLLNPQTKQYNPSNINLEIKCISQHQTTTHYKSLSLNEVAQKKIIPEREYQLSGGLLACLELSCTHIERKGSKPLRKSILKSPQKINANQGFLLLEKVAFEQQKNRDTPQFPKRDSHQLQMQQNEQINLDLGPQLIAIRQQFEKQLEEHHFTKQTLRSIKDLLQKQYNVNRQLNYTIESLKKKVQEQQKNSESLQNHLLQTENLCTALSATLSSKETEIVEMQQLIEDLGEKMIKLTKKNQIIDHLERGKAQLQYQVNGLSKQIQKLRLQLNRQYLQGKEMQKQIDLLKIQNAKVSKSNQHIEKQCSQLLTRQKQYKVTITKLTEERDTIKRQTTRWRTQFCAESQRKDEQISQLEEHCRQLYTRYSEINKKEDMREKMVDKQLVNIMRMDYDKKIEQYEQKQAKLRHYIQVIDEETFNLQEMLQQKEQEQHILLQTIKELQTQVESNKVTGNWWQSILQKEPTPIYNGHDKEEVLMTKNKQLIQILHRNSFIILSAEKTKIQLSALKKQYQLCLEKTQMMESQYKQTKEKIANLYKENKKLQQKNYVLNKQRQSAVKKNIWLQEQIKQSKAAQKLSRKDYQIISFQLIQIQKQRKKQQRQLQISANCLSVIREKSEEHLASSHKFVRQSSIKQSVKPEGETLELYQELAKLLQQRAKDIQQLNSQIRQANNKQYSNSLEELKKTLRKIPICTSKIKMALIKSGYKNLIEQWQQVVGCLLNQAQQFVNIN